MPRLALGPFLPIWVWYIVGIGKGTREDQSLISPGNFVVHRQGFYHPNPIQPLPLAQVQHVGSICRGVEGSITSLSTGLRRTNAEISIDFPFMFRTVRDIV